MESVKAGCFNIIKEGVGSIPVLILGPPEVFIPTMPDELKNYCVFFGVNYPFKIFPKDKEQLSEKYQLHHWHSIEDVGQFYHDIAMNFCNNLKQKKFIVIGPSMMCVLADHLCDKYPDDILAACYLSPAHITEVTKLDIQSAQTFGSAIQNGKEVDNFHFYLDMLHQEAVKDFNDIETFRPIWIDLWRKGTDNIQTQKVLMSIFGGHTIGKSNLNTLIIAGETDGRFSIDKVKAFRLPLNYKRVILPGGHAAHFEYHLEFADVFTGWLTELKLKSPEPKIEDRTIELRKSNAKLKEEIKRRKIIESELRSSRERYKALTAIAPVGIFRFDVNGQFVDKNEVFSKLTGLNKDTIHLMDFIDSIQSSNANFITQSITTMQEKGVPCRFECQFGSTQKRWALCHILQEVINNDIFYIGTLTDLTKRREAEELAYKRQSELAHYARLSTISEMVSGIAHEIAQPLSSISQYAYTLRHIMNDRDTNSQYQSILHKIEKQAERAGLVLQRIKNFIIRKEIKKERVLIRDILFDIKELLHFELKTNLIQLQIHIEEQDSPLYLFVDSIQIQQVILNITKNAIEAMQECNVKEKKITIEVKKQQHNNNLTVTIADTGLGIPKDKLQSIFDQFYTTKEKGTGVGLSISNTIIKAHGGSISVSSQINQGTVFSIQLPYYYELVQEKIYD